MPKRSTKNKNKQESISPAVSGTQPGSEVDAAPQITAYMWGGKEVDANSPEAIAKIAVSPRSTSYFLKQATNGPDRGHLFNPQSPTYNAAFLERAVRQLGKGQYEFRRVSQSAYELYMRFMKLPHNPVHYRNAERAM